MGVLFPDSAALQNCVFGKISQSGTFAKIEKENHEQCIDYDTGSLSKNIKLMEEYVKN